MMSNSSITWFEIPAVNLERAAQFYATVMGKPLERETMGGQEIAVFPFTRPGVSGCLQKGEPHRGGTLVYLDVGTNLDCALDRVAAAGGRIAVGKTALPGNMGHFAHVVDTEGNRVGLHAFAR